MSRMKEYAQDLHDAMECNPVVCAFHTEHA